MPTKIALFSLLLPIFFMGINRATLAKDSAFCSKELEKIVEMKSGSYRVRIFYANDRMCQRLDILQWSRLVFRDEGIGNHYFLGNRYGSGYKRPLLTLIGHGKQLVIKKWTGGAHCCNSLLVFDLGTEFRKISEIDAGNYEAEIVDLDRDGVPEIRVLDDFLAYHFSSFAYSAKAEVVLKYVDGSYSVAPEFMKAPAPPWGSLTAKIQRWRRLVREHSDPADPDWPPPTLIQTMTDLIFTGNEGVAFDLVDRIWPSGGAGKTGFLRSYRAALNDSKYYAEFKRRVCGTGQAC